MNQLRVNIDDLDWDDYVYYYQNKPFFGIGFELFENGKIRTETEFEYGMQYGISREWHENGQLITEDNFKFGIKNGTCKTWYENGQLKNLSEFELGILFKQQEWDRAGKLVGEFALKPTDANYHLLEQSRQREPSREKMIKEKLGKI